MKNIIVICAIDEQIEGVKEIAESIEGFADVGIATYGNKNCPPTVKLKEFANKRGYKFYDSPRQTFIPLDREFHCSEMVAYLNISKHFYEDYDRVYLCHHDIWIKDNPLPYYEKEMTSAWGFVVPLVKIKSGEDRYPKNGFDAKKTNRRLSHEFLIFSKPFVNFFCKGYYTDESLWYSFFIDYDMHSDLMMFDLLPKYAGFNGKTIDSCVIHEPRKGFNYTAGTVKLTNEKHT